MNLQDKEKLFALCIDKGISDIEFYIEEQLETKIQSNQGNLQISHNRDKGIGIRCKYNDCVGFASSTWSEENLPDIIEIARTNAQRSSKKRPAPFVQNQQYEEQARIDEVKVTKITQHLFKIFSPSTSVINFTNIQKRIEIVTFSSHISDFLSYNQLEAMDLNSRNTILMKKKKLSDFDIKFDNTSDIKSMSVNDFSFTRIALSPEINSMFISIIGESLKYSNIKMGKTLIFEKKFAKELTLIDKGLNTFSKFDGEGFKKQSTVLIKDGEIQSFLYNSEEAFLNNEKPTANAYRLDYHTLPRYSFNHLTIQQGTKDLSEVIGSNEKVLLLNTIKNNPLIINPLNGNFLIRVDGHVEITNDTICKINNILVSGNIFEVYSNINYICSDIEVVFSYGLISSPTILIDSSCLSITQQ
ncbi:MAG: hypothetical protein KAX49_17390 [Halanaerobiales bacterium]|nr:hypothetical protein [Halanaerobiales bacterium]